MAVVGGGVVGCAIARRFTLNGAAVVLLERGPDILSGASKANSAILHTGFDAPRDSLELACIREGHAEYRRIHERLNLPLLTTGAVVAAWSEEEAARLPAIVEQARDNGIENVRRIPAATVRQHFPDLATGPHAGVLVPDEAVIDPWSAPLAYMRQAVENGARLVLRAEVTGGRLDGDRWQLETTAGTVAARTVINCAGLFGDRLDERCLGTSGFEIRPRRGQFLVLDKAARRHVPGILLPVPTERTKGVLIAPTAFGNVLVGPTAEEQRDREHAPVDAEGLARLNDAANRLIPALARYPVTATYAGLRPATEHKAYQLQDHTERRWITVGGIRSTGLSAALGLAHRVYALYERAGGGHTPPTDPRWPVVPNLAEDRPRDWASPGNGEIVCHCELVTRREIENALEGSVPARDLSGLKRRTRATMGRCQGFYCAARLAEITRDRLNPGLATGGVDG